MFIEVGGCDIGQILFNRASDAEKRFRPLYSITLLERVDYITFDL